jgi:hypothetical protein
MDFLMAAVTLHKSKEKFEEEMVSDFKSGGSNRQILQKDSIY